MTSNFLQKMKKELANLIHAVRIYSQDIEKCVIQAMKSGKRHLIDGMELPNQEKIRRFGEKET